MFDKFMYKILGSIDTFLENIEKIFTRKKDAKKNKKSYK